MKAVIRMGNGFYLSGSNPLTLSSDVSRALVFDVTLVFSADAVVMVCNPPLSDTLGLSADQVDKYRPELVPVVMVPKVSDLCDQQSA